MTRRASVTAIGGFVSGLLGLLVVVVLFFSSGDYFSDKKHFVLFFDGSLNGLSIGAPVSIKGVQIGEVIDIDIQVREKEQTLQLLTPVTVAILRDKLSQLAGGDDGEQPLERLIDRGLRAQLRTQSLLTGLLYIEVNFHPDSPLNLHSSAVTELPELPTIPTELQQLTRNLERLDLAKLLDDVQSIASGLEKLVNNEALQGLAGGAGALVGSLQNAAEDFENELDTLRRHFVPLAKRGEDILGELQNDIPEISAQFKQSLSAMSESVQLIEKVSQELEFALSDDSPAMHSVTEAAREVERAARSIRAFGETLERQPEALLRGKER